MASVVIKRCYIGHMKVQIIEETLTDYSCVYNITLETEASRIEIACSDFSKAEEMFVGFEAGHFMLHAIESRAEI